MYTRFRMTTKNTRIVLLWGLTVPVLTYYLASFSNVSLHTAHKDRAYVRLTP